MRSGRGVWPTVVAIVCAIGLAACGSSSPQASAAGNGGAAGGSGGSGGSAGTGGTTGAAGAPVAGQSGAGGAGTGAAGTGGAGSGTTQAAVDSLCTQANGSALYVVDPDTGNVLYNKIGQLNDFAPALTYSTDGNNVLEEATLADLGYPFFIDVITNDQSKGLSNGVSVITGSSPAPDGIVATLNFIDSTGKKSAFICDGLTGTVDLEGLPNPDWSGFHLTWDVHCLGGAKNPLAMNEIGCVKLTGTASPTEGSDAPSPVTQESVDALCAQAPASALYIVDQDAGKVLFSRLGQLGEFEPTLLTSPLPASSGFGITLQQTSIYGFVLAIGGSSTGVASLSADGPSITAQLTTTDPVSGAQTTTDVSPATGTINIETLPGPDGSGLHVSWAGQGTAVANVVGCVKL